MKTHILLISRVFPATHRRKGEPTQFKNKIPASPFFKYDSDLIKLHTLRANYELWKKRINEVLQGKAILSVREWSGQPYNSQQTTLFELDKNSGIGIQKVVITEYCTKAFVDTNQQRIVRVAANDGLDYVDFQDWFKNYDLSKPLAMIHFTDFRY